MRSHGALARAPSGLCLRSKRLTAPSRVTRARAVTAFQTDTAHSSSISGDSDRQHLLSFDPEAWARRLPWPNNNNSRWTTSGFRSLGSTIYIIAQTPSYRVLTLGDGMHLLAFPCEADAATLLEHLGERISHDGAFVEARPAASLSGTIRRLSKDHAVCKDDIQDLCWWAMRHGKRVCVVDKVTYGDGHVHVTGRPARDTGLVALKTGPIISGRIHTHGDHTGQAGPSHG